MLRLLLLSLTALLGACGAEADFAKYESWQVWRALKAVSENPDYNHEDYTKRWTVMENIVHVDEEDQRIDINRRLERVLRRPRTNPLHEDVTWHFQVQLLPGSENRVRFKNIGWALPTRVHFEADRFFAEVHRFLAGLPPPPEMQERLQQKSKDSESSS